MIHVIIDIINYRRDFLDKAREKPQSSKNFNVLLVHIV